MKSRKAASLLLGGFLCMLCLFGAAGHVQAKAALTKLKNGKTYRFDLNRDGKKEKIQVKQVSVYGYDEDRNEDTVAVRSVRINGKQKIKAEGYKGVNLWVFTSKKKSVIIEQGVAGTGSTWLSYYYYSNGKYKKKSLSIPGEYYYWEEPHVSGEYLKVEYEPKWHWVQSFGEDSRPFPVSHKYTLSGGKLKKTTKYPAIAGDKKFISGTTFRMGKTAETASDEDGDWVYRDDVVQVITVINRDDVGMVYKIKVGKKTGWYTDSSEISMLPY